MNCYDMLEKIYQSIEELYPFINKSVCKIKKQGKDGYSVIVNTGDALIGCIKFTINKDEMVTDSNFAYRIEFEDNEIRVGKNFVSVVDYNGITTEAFFSYLSTVLDTLEGLKGVQENLNVAKTTFEQELLKIEV